MRRFENQTVEREECARRLHPKEWRDKYRFTQNETIEDMEFVKCEFIGQGLTTYGAPVNRSTAHNLHLKNCKVNSFYGHGAIFDEIVVDGLRTSVSPVILCGCAFRHVVLKGQLGSFLINRNIDILQQDADRNAAFIQANDEFYESVGWALDISEAKAACIEIRGSVPVRLIRRNPDEQFVLTREVAASGDWRGVEGCDRTAFRICVQVFLDSGAPDTVVVANRRSKYYKAELEFFHRLKDAGLLT
jgi:hypothetical protein